MGVSIPHNLEAEESVLGAMLLKSEVIDSVSESLTASDFYKPEYGSIFDAMVMLRANGSVVDAVTVYASLEAQGLLSSLSDPSIFVSLQANVPSIGHASHYAKIVMDCALRRRLLSASASLANQAQDMTMSVEDTLEDYQVVLASLGVSALNTEPDDVAVEDFVEEMLAKGVTNEWVVPKLVRRGHKVMLVAAEGAGKSWVLRYIAVCAAYGVRPFRHTRTQPIRTLIVDAENPSDSLYESFSAILKKVTDFNPQQETVNRLWWRPEGMNLRNRVDLAKFENVLRVRRPDLVCLGPLYAVYDNNPRESWETGAIEVQKILKKLIVRYNFALMIEDHAPQSDNQGKRHLRPYGSSMWLRWPDIGIGMEPIGESGNAFELIRWRGDRVPNDWPTHIERGVASGSPWPFTGRWEKGNYDQEAF